MLTIEKLSLIYPKCPSRKLKLFFPSIQKALIEGEINTKLRIAAFIAELGHESGQLRYMEEIADGSAYEGRKDLGNDKAGDGKKYKGRGPIQLTGKNNYRKFGKSINIDLVSNPYLVATPEYGFRAAVWFWTTHNLNELADNGEFDKITRIINGGTNGQQDRRDLYKKALEVL